MHVVVQPSSSHRWLSSKWVWQILAGGLTPPTCALYCVICLDTMWFYPRCELRFDSSVICLVQCSLPWCDINCDAIPSEMWIVIWFHLRCEVWYDFIQETCVCLVLCDLLWRCVNRVVWTPLWFDVSCDVCLFQEVKMVWNKVYCYANGCDDMSGIFCKTLTLFDLIRVLMLVTSQCFLQ